MTMISLDLLAERYEELPRQLYDLAGRHPNATVVRNDVGNLSILNADGSHVGWIDVLTGEVVNLP